VKLIFPPGFARAIQDVIFTHKVVPQEQDFLLLSPSSAWRDLFLVLDVARCGSPKLPALVRTCK
jgi:hypothetical protein